MDENDKKQIRNVKLQKLRDEAYRIAYSDERDLKYEESITTSKWRNAARKISKEKQNATSQQNRTEAGTYTKTKAGLEYDEVIQLDDLSVDDDKADTEVYIDFGAPAATVVPDQVDKKLQHNDTSFGHSSFDDLKSGVNVTTTMKIPGMTSPIMNIKKTSEKVEETFINQEDEEDIPLPEDDVVEELLEVIDESSSRAAEDIEELIKELTALQEEAEYYEDVENEQQEQAQTQEELEQTQLEQAQVEQAELLQQVANEQLHEQSDTEQEIIEDFDETDTMEAEDDSFGSYVDFQSTHIYTDEIELVDYDEDQDLFEENRSNESDGLSLMDEVETDTDETEFEQTTNMETQDDYSHFIKEFNERLYGTQQQIENEQSDIVEQQYDEDEYIDDNDEEYMKDEYDGYDEDELEQYYEAMELYGEY
jgi:hypothetical protein